MFLKNLTLALCCLLLGGFAGYQLRSLEQSAFVSSAGFDLEAKAGRAPSTAASGLAGKKVISPSAGLPPSAVTLGEQMQSLLVNYDDDAARKSVGAMSASDIQAALTLVAALPKSAERDSLRWNLYRAWARTNPTAAWKAALADPLETDEGYLLGAVVGEMAKTKPEAAATLALGLGMGGRRTGALQQVIEEWGKVDPAGAVGFWNGHPDLPVRSWSLTSAINENWEKDPVRAASLVLTLADPQARSSAVSNLMNQWAALDPQAALSWAQTIGNDTLRHTATAEAIRGWSNKDPKAAMAEAQKLQDSGTRASAIQSAWYNWLRKDATAAMAYLGESYDEKLMENLSWNFAYNTGGFTQQEKVSLVEKLPDGEPKQAILRTLADSQIRRGQYNQAMELLNNLPDSSERDGSVQRLGQQWAEHDSKAAAEWLKLQPDSSDRDLAVAGFANVLARTDPQAALQWADTIPDAGVKTGSLKNIALRWLTADSAAAEAWLTGTDALSDSDKKDVLDTSQSSGAERTTFGVNVSDRR